MKEKALKQSIRTLYQRSASLAKVFLVGGPWNNMVPCSSVVTAIRHQYDGIKESKRRQDAINMTAIGIQNESLAVIL